MLQTVIRALVKQVLVDGFFHGDPHPGNFLIGPQTGVVTFLDVGLADELSQARRLEILDLLWSFTNGDTQGMATVALRVTEHRGTVDEDAFRAEVERLYSQFWVYPSDTHSVARMVEALRRVMAAYDLRLSGDFTLAIKAVSGSEKIAFTLAPALKWLPLTYDEASRQLREHYSAERVVESVKTQALRGAKEVLRELPSLHDATGQWLEQYRRGRFVVKLNTDELAGSVNHFSRSMRRVTVALILMGLLIGSAIAASLLVALQNTQWAFLPILALGIFVGAALLSVAVVLRMLNAERVEQP